jgi:uncharacterized protein YgbK (DUF1537 family)
MQTYLIITDDFTGATDTGLQYARNGIPTHVQVGCAEMLQKDHALVLDTESRNLDAPQARDAVQRALSSLSLDEDVVVLKKVDSTLRGNLVDEVDEISRLLGFDMILVATAFPAMGRTCHDGVVRVHGVPLLQSEYGKDPRKPVQEDNLRILFSSLAEVTPLSLEDLHAGVFPSLQSRLVVCDAVVQDDLDRIVAWARQSAKRVLYVGSAGLGEALVTSHRPDRTVFGLAASLSEVTRYQIAYAEESGIETIVLPVELLMVEAELDAYAEQIIYALNHGKDILCCVSSVHDRRAYEASLQIGASLGLQPDEVGKLVQQRFGLFAQRVLSKTKVGGLFLTGGDTAIAFLALLGIQRVEVVREVCAGIPLLQVLDPEYRQLRIVTKAGAFGKNDAIAYAFRVLKEY